MEQFKGHDSRNLMDKMASKCTQMQQEDKKAAVHAEIARVNQLPSNSTYAVHRMRVLNKLLQLMSIQRSISQEEELELLFATLSL